MTSFRVLPTPSDVATAGVEGLVAAAQAALQARGSFHLALSGGRTPHAAFHLLRQKPWVSEVPWRQVEFFWTDERAVPPTDPRSNFGEAQRALLDHLPGLRRRAVHRFQAEVADLRAAARAYETELRRHAPRAAGRTPSPVLDLIWLGMGADGHTASLFPGSETLDVTDRLAVATFVPAVDEWRLTVTLPLLRAARAVTFLVTGADKAPAVARIRAGDDGLPAGRVRGPHVTWLLDAAAAGGER